MWKESFDFLAQQVQCFRGFCSYGVPFLTNKLLISFEGGLQMFCFQTGEMDGYGFLLNSIINNNNNNEKQTHLSISSNFFVCWGFLCPFWVGSWLVLDLSRRQPQWQSVSSFFTRALALGGFLERVYIQMWPCMEYDINIHFPSLN